MVKQEFKITCRNCEFSGIALSAGSAEEIANDHVLEWTDGDGRRNYHHEVEITQVTVVLRDR